MSKLKIVLGEPGDYSPKAQAIYKKLGQLLLANSKKDFDKFLPSVDVLVIRLGIKADKKLLDKAKNLKVIATNTTGLNHVDQREAERRRIKVISLRGHTEFLDKIHATPELTWGLLISLIRNIHLGFESVKRGEWNRNKFAGNELQNKTFGIIGLGRIGKIMARYARAFGMNVIAADPNISKAAMFKLGVKKVSLDNLLKKSDVVSIHVLHSSQTEKMLKEKHFKMMKPDALFLNSARGELIDEVALYKALRKKWIAGAALDVMRNEDQGGKHLRKSKLWNYARKNTNLLIVPHLGGAAVEAWQATEEYLAGLVLKYFNAK